MLGRSGGLAAAKLDDLIDELDVETRIEHGESSDGKIFDHSTFGRRLVNIRLWCRSDRPTDIDTITNNNALTYPHACSNANIDINSSFLHIQPRSALDDSRTTRVFSGDFWGEMELYE